MPKRGKSRCGRQTDGAFFSSLNIIAVKREIGSRVDYIYWVGFVCVFLAGLPVVGD